MSEANKAEDRKPYKVEVDPIEFDASYSGLFMSSLDFCKPILGGVFSGGDSQRLGATEAHQQAEHEGRQNEAPEELPQGGGEMFLDKRTQVRRCGGEQGVRRGQNGQQQGHQGQSAAGPCRENQSAAAVAFLPGGEDGGGSAQVAEQPPE